MPVGRAFRTARSDRALRRRGDPRSQEAQAGRRVEARHLTGERYTRTAGPAPWCGGGRGLRAPASRHAKRNPKDHDSRGVRALLRRAAAAGAAGGVDAAIADGATIDEITALIRGEGGACSRSAVGRYTKNVRDLIRRQQETARDRDVGARARRANRGPSGAHPDRDPADDDALHPRRAQQAETPPTPEELSRLSLVLRRIEGTDKLRIERERRPRRRRRRRPRPRPARGSPNRRRASRPRPSPPSARSSRGDPAPERAVTSAPVDPWNPSESHLIPLNPGESRPENDRDMSRPNPKTHPLSPSPGGGGGTPPQMPVTPSSARVGGAGTQMAPPEIFAQGLAEGSTTARS